MPETQLPYSQVATHPGLLGAAARQSLPTALSHTPYEELVCSCNRVADAGGANHYSQPYHVQQPAAAQAGAGADTGTGACTGAGAGGRGPGGGHVPSPLKEGVTLSTLLPKTPGMRTPLRAAMAAWAASGWV